MNAQYFSNGRVIRLADRYGRKRLRELVGVSRSTIYRWELNGTSREVYTRILVSLEGSKDGKADAQGLDSGRVSRGDR